MRKAGIPKEASIVSIEDVWTKDDEGTDQKKYFFNEKNTQYLEGPGTIGTVLESNGGSAFLIVEWSTEKASVNSVAELQ